MWASQVAQGQKTRLPMLEAQVDPQVGKILWGRKWQPSAMFSSGKSHGQRRVVGYAVHGVTKEPDATEHITHHLVVELMMSAGR